MHHYVLIYRLELLSPSMQRQMWLGLLLAHNLLNLITRWEMKKKWLLLSFTNLSYTLIFVMTWFFLFEYFQIHLIDFDDESNVINKNVFMHSAGEIWWGLTLVWYDRRESWLTIAALKWNYKDLYGNLSYVS